MPPSPAQWPTALCTLIDLHDQLNIPISDTSNDAKLDQFIQAAQPVVEDIVGHVVPQEYDEWHDGGSTEITVLHVPVLQVIAVNEFWGPINYELVQVPSPELGTTWSYMWTDYGRIVRRTAGGGLRQFPSGKDQVHVQYVAGLATVPMNVWLGTLELIRHWFQWGQQGLRPQFGAPSEDTTNQAATPSGFAIPRRVLELLGASERYPSLA